MGRAWSSLHIQDLVLFLSLRSNSRNLCYIQYDEYEQSSEII